MIKKLGRPPRPAKDLLVRLTVCITKPQMSWLREKMKQRPASEIVRGMFEREMATAQSAAQ